MKNKNIINISLILTTVLIVMFYAGESWSQSKHNANISANKVASLTLPNTNSQQIVPSQKPSNFYVDSTVVKHMKEVQIKKGDAKGKSDDTAKAQCHANSPFRQYYGVGLPHLIDSQGTFGGFMSFDDGSFWAVDPRDIISAMYWDPMAIIFVQQSNDPFSTGYNYVLINNDNDESVRAMYIGGR